GRIAQEEGRWAEARAAYTRLAERYPHAETAAEARWRAAWVRYLAGEMAPAAEAFARLAGRSARVARIAAEYWQARVLARLGRRAEARELFVHVAERHPRSYYAGLAEQRLGWREAVGEPRATEGAPPFPGELAGAHGERAREEVGTNIDLGTRLLARLLRQYDGSMVKALAAYNGGEDAVAKWERRYAGREPDEFVELISFRETRDYVKSVLRNYRVYRRLYATPNPATRSAGSPPKAP